MKLKTGKIYRFNWLDTYNFLGWHFEDEINKKAVSGYFQSTIGFFIKEVDNWYVVAMHHNPNTELGFPEWGNISYIPKACVKKIWNTD